MHRLLVDRRITIEEVKFAEILRVNEYLETLRGGRRYPSRSAILPEELSVALGRISILDVVPGSPPDFVNRLYGTFISAADGDEMTNRSAREIEPEPYRDMVERHYREALDAAGPVFHEIEVEVGRQRAAFQRGLFPLSDDDATISKLFSVSAWSPELGRCWENCLQEDDGGGAPRAPVVRCGSEPAHRQQDRQMLRHLSDLQ